MIFIRAKRLFHNSRYYLMSTATLLILAACASSTPAPVDTDDSHGILIFGDSGYDLNYVGKGDYEEKYTEEEFVAAERKKWIKDKRPIEEFEPRPHAVSPASGGVMPLSTMWRISESMQKYCADTLSCELGVMLGDNIYPAGATLGLDGVDDAIRFKDLLGDPFGNLVEQPTGYLTYVTLGNHDFQTSRAGGFAEIEYLENHDGFYMDGPFYSVKPPAANGEIELFIFETTMLVETVPVLESDLNADGTEVNSDTYEVSKYHVKPLTEAEKNMSAWLAEALEASTAKWKIVVAHHPIWSGSGSKFEQARVLRQRLLPAICKYADIYLAGHDHTLEIHTDDCSAALGEATERPLVQIVSGAAAKQRPINSNFIRQQELKYPQLDTVWAVGLTSGFTHMQIEGDKATISMMTIPDMEGSDYTVVYEYEFYRRSHLVSKDE